MISRSHQFNFQCTSFSLFSCPLELDPHLSTLLYNLVTVGKDFFAL